MKKTYVPRDNCGFSVYSLDYYNYFIQSLSGASEVVPLRIDQRRDSLEMMRGGSAVHHVEPEAVTIRYECEEYSTGDRIIKLNYHGNPDNIKKLRARVRELEKKTRAN